MSLYLFSAVEAAVTVAGFSSVVGLARLAGRLAPRPRLLLALGGLAFYGAVLLFRPLAWPVIDAAVPAGALGIVILLEGTLQAPSAVAVFLALAATADVISMAAGVSHVLVERFRTGQSHLLLYLMLVVPIRGATIPTVGITDLFIGATAATALLRLKVPPAGVMGSTIGGFLCAAATGLWLGPTPALPFLAVPVGILVQRHAQRLRSR